ncbi:MAG TPA: sulfatase-like hydrolase/transferase, partial [Anseongella sp.]
MHSLFTLLLLLVTLASGISLRIGQGLFPKKESKPNVLFLFADDQRADALGISGNPYIRTPHIDQLAREGSRFSNAYVMGGNHGAICMASRAMLLSGRSLF